MKIALVTWYGASNFGTGLQAYALMRYLMNKGNEVRLVQYFNPKYTKNTAISMAYYAKRKLGAVKGKLFPRYKKEYKEMSLARRGINKQYMKRYLSMYPAVSTRRQYKKLMSSMDCFITGSDQIWNPYHSNAFYLLNFVEGKPRYAYASSIGVNELPDEFKDTYRTNLCKFRKIGLREQRGADIVNELLGEKKAIQVLDPTFLLKPTDWADFAKEVNLNDIELGSYMLVYTIGRRPEYPGFIKAMKEKYGIEKVVVARSHEGLPYTDVDMQLTKIAPMHFIYLLRNARLVCTDSFHATALSINHNKNFVELLRFDVNDVKSQNSRIYDVLAHYCLKERLYTGGTIPKEQIDFTKSNEVLENDRKKSYAFIDECLDDAAKQAKS